jgi:hypothetical protein
VRLLVASRIENQCRARPARSAAAGNGVGGLFRCENEGAKNRMGWHRRKIFPRGQIEKEKPQCGKEKNILLVGLRRGSNSRLLIYISDS